VIHTIWGQLLIIEWSATLLVAVVFLVVYGWPSRYEDRTMSWHIVSVTAVAAIESAGFLALAAGVQIPPWVYVAIYGAGAAVMAWRLGLLLNTRREQRGGR